jgi:hypothetical protein
VALASTLLRVLIDSKPGSDKQWNCIGHSSRTRQLDHREHNLEEKAESAMKSLLYTTDTPSSNRTSCTNHRDVPKNDKCDTISPQIWARIESPAHVLPTRTAHSEIVLFCRFSLYMTCKRIVAIPSPTSASSSDADSNRLARSLGKFLAPTCRRELVHRAASERPGYSRRRLVLRGRYDA